MGEVVNFFRTVYETVQDVAYLKTATQVHEVNKYTALSTEALLQEQERLNAVQRKLTASMTEQGFAVTQTASNYQKEVAALQQLKAEMEAAIQLRDKSISQGRAAAETGNVQAAAKFGEEAARAEKIIEETNNNLRTQAKITMEANVQHEKTAANVDLVRINVEKTNASAKKLNDTLNERTRSEGKTGFFETLKQRIALSISSIEQFSKDFDNLTKTVHRTTIIGEKFMNIADRISIAVRGKPIFDYDKSMRGMGDSALAASKNIKVLGVEIQGTGQAILAAETSAAPFIAIFAAITAAVTAIIGPMMMFVGALQSAVPVVAAFEEQIMTLRSLVAMEDMAKDSTLSFADATKAATDRTVQLNDWMERLAIQSRYTSEDVKGMLMNFKQYGFAVDESARLTKATMDWGTATGKSGDKLQAIAYALGQVRSAGRLMGGELMQLRNAGFDMDAVYRELGKTMGKTAQEVRAMGNENINAQQFLSATLAVMESTGGAAKEAANSFNGLLSSLSEIGPMFLREFFGPMDAATGKIQGLLGAIQPYLQKLVETLLDPQVLNAVRDMGIRLGEMAENAFAWGSDLVTNYAKGIVSGIGMVIDALSSLAEAVAYWLMPGSPPRILPDIDKWGAGTMQAWLGGFKQVNANEVFFSLGDAMETFMRSQGNKESPHLIDQIFGGKAAIKLATEEFARLGIVTQQTLNKIGASAGQNGDLFRNYVDNFFKAQAASLALSKVQKEAADIAQLYDERLAGINTRINEITEARTKRDEEKQIKRLQRIINDPRASAKRRLKAKEDLELLTLSQQAKKVEKEKNSALTEMQKRIEAAQKELDAATERLKLSEQQMKAMEKQNSLMEEQLRLLERLANALEKADKGGGGAGKPGGKPIAIGGLDFGSIGDEAGSFFDDLKKRLGIDELQGKWDKFTGSLGNLWRAVQPYIAPTQNFLNNIGTRLGTLGTALVNFWDRNFKPVLDNISVKLPPAQLVFDAVTTAVDNAVKAFVDFGVNVGLPALQGFVDWVKEEWPSWSVSFVEVTEDASQGANEFLDAITPLTDVLAGVGQVVILAFQGMLREIEKTFTLIKVAWGTFNQIFAPDWDRIWNDVKLILDGVWDAMLDLIKGTLTNIKLAINGFLSLVKGDWTGAWNAVRDIIRNTMVTIENIIKDMMPGLKQAFTDLTNWAIGRAIALKEGVVEWFNKLKTELPFILAAIKQGVEDRFNEAKEVAVGAIQALYNIITSPARFNWALVGQNIIQSIINGMWSIITWAVNQATQIFDAIMAVFTPSDDGGGDGPPGPTPEFVQTKKTNYAANRAALLGTTVVKQYNLTVSSERPSQGIVYDFRIMEVLGGAS